MIDLLFPLAIGALGVLQNTLNKKIAESMGLAYALLINGAILFVLGAALFWTVKSAPTLYPELFRAKEGASTSLTWKHLIPGIAGFAIIVMVPMVIERMDATRVFLGIIVAQIITSILWDYFAESVPVTLPKAIGAALAVIGAIVSIL